MHRRLEEVDFVSHESFDAVKPSDQIPPITILGMRAIREYFIRDSQRGMGMRAHVKFVSEIGFVFKHYFEYRVGDIACLIARSRRPIHNRFTIEDIRVTRKERFEDWLARQNKEDNFAIHTLGHHLQYCRLSSSFRGHCQQLFRVEILQQAFVRPFVHDRGTTLVGTCAVGTMIEW